MDVPPTFITWIRSQVDSFQNEFPILNKKHAFAAWAVSFIHEIDKEIAVDLTDTLDRGDAGIDGWYYDTDEGVFNLHQAYYPDEPDEQIGPEKPRQLLSGFDLLLNHSSAARRSEKLGRISNELISSFEDEANVSLNCIIFGELTGTAKQEFIDRCNSHRKSPAPEIFGLKRLYELEVMRNTVDELKNTHVIIPIDPRKKFAVESPNTPSGIGQSIVINFNAKQFVEVIKQYSPQIYAPNVRYHLGHQNRVNKKISATIRDPIEKHHFWHYNNGITIIVNELSINEKSKTITLKNPGIVNGAQTIQTLINNSGNIDNNIDILARVITINSSTEGKQKRKDIASATNSQSPVNPFDLHSNDTVQREIQENFNSLNPSWHYQRKRGEWNSLTRSRRSRYSSGTVKRRVEMVSIAQFYRAYQGYPVEAIDEREKLFEDSETYKNIFNRNYDVRNYILAQKLFLLFDNYLKVSNLSEINHVTGGFSPETLNRILRAKKLIVAHCVSLSAFIIVQRYGTIDGDKSLKIVNYIDNNQNSFRDNLLKLVLNAIAQFSEEGDNVPQDIRELFRDCNTLQKLQTRLSRFIQSISTMAPITGLFVNL